MSKANPQFTMALKLKKKFRVAVRDSKGVRLSPHETAFVMLQIDELSYKQTGIERNEFLTKIYRESFIEEVDHGQ